MARLLSLTALSGPWRRQMVDEVMKDLVVIASE